MRRLVFCVPLVGFMACADPLAPDFVLDGPKILGVRAEPPDLLPDGGVKLDALIYLPNGAGPVTYTWSWCASVDANLQCAISVEQLIQQIDPTGALGVKLDYSLGSGAQATLTYPIDPSVLSAVCGGSMGQGNGGMDGGATDGGDAGDAGDAGVNSGSADSSVDAGATLRCPGGSLTLTVLLTATVGAQQLQAAKSVTLYITAPATVNTNPTISGLSAFAMAATLPPDGGDRSDDGIADAAGEAGNRVIGIAAGDDGGIQLIMHVPETATDSYTGRLVRTADGGLTDDAGDDAGDAGDAGTATTLSVPGVTPLELRIMIGDAGGGSDGGGSDGGDGGSDGGGRSDGGGAADGGRGEPSDGGHGEPGSDGGMMASGADGGMGSGIGSGTGMGGGDGGGGGTRSSIYESLTATWYVQSGTLDSTSTTLSPATVGGAARDFTPLELNRWVPPGSGTYTIVVVVRDNRNGIGWYTVPIKVTR